MVLLIANLLLLFTASTVFSQSPQKTAQQPQDNARQEQLDEATRLGQSVVSLYNAGKYDEAQPIAERVVKIREQVLDKDDDRLLTAIFNLAAIQLARGRASDAKSLFEKVLHSYERTGGIDNVKLANVLDQLAIAWYRLGQPVETEHAYERSLAIRQKAFGSNHAEVARSLRGLAEFYQFEGDYKKAEPLYQQLVELRKRLGNASLISDALERYACLLHKTNRSQEAEKLENEALGDNSRPPSQLLSGGVVNGKALHLAQPPYPAEARNQHASGRVTVRILIDETGKVIRACAVEGQRALLKVSESAAYNSKFTPTRIEDKPVKVNGTIIYNFVAQ